MNKKIPKEDLVRMPDGNMVTRASLREGLVDGIVAAMREARNDGYQAGDWMKHAAGKVVDHLFELDAYFDKMLDLQKMIAKGSKGFKSKPEVIGEKAIASD